MKTKDTSLDDIADAISALASNIDERFEQVDQRFNQADRRFAQIDGRFAQIDDRFEQIDQRFERVESELHGIRVEQRAMREWLERIDASINGLTSDITEVYDRIVVLEKQAPLTQAAQKELEKSFAQLMEWAKQVSIKTGVKLPKI